MEKQKQTDPGRVRKAIEDSSKSVAALAAKTEQIAAICNAVAGALKAGCKVLTAGNGGSAAEALHMAEELTGRFRSNRRSLPGLALVADSTALTCIGNDFGFDRIFSRQIEGLGMPGDVLVLFSTSGKSANLIFALEAAKKKGMKTVCLLGRGGGPLAGKGDYEVVVDGETTDRIQEAHQVIMHIMLGAIEEAFG